MLRILPAALAAALLLASLHTVPAESSPAPLHAGRGEGVLVAPDDPEIPALVAYLEYVVADTAWSIAARWYDSGLRVSITCASDADGDFRATVEWDGSAIGRGVFLGAVDECALAAHPRWDGEGTARITLELDGIDYVGWFVVTNAARDDAPAPRVVRPGAARSEWWGGEKDLQGVVHSSNVAARFGIIDADNWWLVADDHGAWPRGLAAPTRTVCISVGGVTLANTYPWWMVRFASWENGVSSGWNASQLATGTCSLAAWAESGAFRVDATFDDSAVGADVAWGVSISDRHSPSCYGAELNERSPVWQSPSLSHWCGTDLYDPYASLGTMLYEGVYLENFDREPLKYPPQHPLNDFWAAYDYVWGPSA